LAFPLPFLEVPMIGRTLALIALAPLSLAGQVTYTATSPVSPFQNTTGPWLAHPTIQIPQFDRTLGQLQQVELSTSTRAVGSIFTENLSASVLNCDTAYYMFVMDPTGSSTLGGNTLVTNWSLQPFDGTVDFAGPSGLVTQINELFCLGIEDPAHPGLCFPEYGDTFFPFVLDEYVGAGTIARSYAIELSGPTISGASICTPHPTTTIPMVSDVSASASIEVSVTYSFSDYPSRFCFFPNTQSGSNCPCGYSWQYGCGSSANPSGADLVPLGSSLLSNDSFVLSAEGLPASGIGLFFQGTTSSNWGTQFGDGVRCVNGSVIRLVVRQATMGQMQYPIAGDLPISQKGFVPVSGGYRAYQVWYRDPAPGFCTPSTFNLTSAVATVWTP
jgi:hypothetical protein